MVRNVALWGLGKHAINNLLPSILGSKNIKLVGLWTRNSLIRNEICNSLNIKSYSNEDEILSDIGSDTIILATPTGLHISQGLKVLNAKKNLWSEKSLYVPESSKLLSIALKNNLEIRELFMFLYHNQYKNLTSLLEQNDVGKIISISCKFGFPHLEESNIRYDPKLGGGALFDAGVYTLAAAHAILGPNPISASAKMFYENDYDVDIRGHASLEYPNGQHAFLEWGFGLSYSNEIRIWCENANIIINRSFSKPPNFDSQIDIIYSNGLKEVIKTGQDNHFKNMFEEEAYMNKADWISGQSNLISMILKNNKKLN